MYGHQDEDQPDENGWIGEDKLLLCLQGVDGKCGIKGWETCIDVMSFSWNLARQAPESRLPSRIRQAQFQYQREEAKKERALMGLPEDDEEEEQKKKKQKQEDGAAAAAPTVPLGTSSSAAPLVEPELKFDDSEVEPRTASTLQKPHVGDFTVTKFSDWSSPQLYQLQLSQRRGIEVSFQIVRERVKNFVPKVLTSEEKAAAAAKAQKRQSRGFGGFGGDYEQEEEEAGAPAASAEPPVEKEFVMKQQWVLQDAFLGNVSISGGSGGQPVETLSINFESFQYKYADYPRSERGGRRGRRAAPTASAASSSQPGPIKVPEMSIIYDGLRQVAQRYDMAVSTELNKNDELRPSASVVLEYL